MKRHSTVLLYLQSQRNCDGLPVRIQCHLSQGMFNILGVIYKHHVLLCMYIRLSVTQSQGLYQIFLQLHIWYFWPNITDSITLPTQNPLYEIQQTQFAKSKLKNQCHFTKTKQASSINTFSFLLSRPRNAQHIYIVRIHNIVYNTIQKHKIYTI